jgi:hypothetical protein
MSTGQSRSMSRRAFLRGAATTSGGAIAGRGLYALLEEFVTPARAEAAPTSRGQEQYLIDRLEVILDNGTTVVIPPIYNDVITAKLAAGRTWDRAALRSAQSRLEAALARVEAPYPATAAGITIVVAWGLPYFRTYVNGPWQAKAPKLLPVSSGQLAVADAIRFPSDPDWIVLEDNHVAFKIRSDSQTIIRSVESQLFDDPNSRAYVGDLFDLTSKRIGFLGRGFGTKSAMKTLATAAGVDGSSSIPDRAQLSLGFTSTQTAALPPDNLPSFETLRGVTDQYPSGYFARGTAMHLSHLNLELDAWYGKGYGERVRRMHAPNTNVPTDGKTVTLPNGPATVATKDQIMADAKTGLVGHNQLLQMATRLGADGLDNYGRLRRKGTAVPAREDFNTLDDPFAWYPGAPSDLPKRAGMHFAVFVPSSAAFHRARTSMDGVLPDGTNLRDGVNSDGTPLPTKLIDGQIGINSVMEATHRQNFLVPPRSRRSFPLAELV